MPDTEFGLALLISGVVFAIGVALAAAAGDPDIDTGALYAAAAGLAAAGAIICIGRLLPARLRGMAPIPVAPVAAGPPYESNLRDALRGSLAVINNQFATCASLEAQLVGFLAVLGATAGLFAVVPHAVQAQRWVLLAGTLAAAAICLFGLFATGELSSGPFPAQFYSAHSVDPPTSYLDALVKALDEVIQRNDEAIVGRQGALALSILWVLVTAATWGIVRLAVH